MEDRVICPVVFSTDENYVMPTAIAIRSMIDNFSGDTLEIIIISNRELSQNAKKVLSRAIAHHTNTIIIYRIIDDSTIEGVSSHIGHITIATYYRLFLPEILKQYDRCLYLDGDICVCGDINQLLTMSFNHREYAAGVKAASIVTKRIGRKKRMEILNIDSLDNYINAGVLLMNLDAMRRDRMQKKFIELASRNFPVQDQDVINVACFDNILIMPPKYNSMPVLFQLSHGRLRKAYIDSEISEAKDNPSIIHFADSYKPWKYDDVHFCEIWDKYYYAVFGELISGRQHSKWKRRTQRLHDIVGYGMKVLKHSN